MTTSGEKNIGVAPLFAVPLIVMCILALWFWAPWTVLTGKLSDDDEKRPGNQPATEANSADGVQGDRADALAGKINEALAEIERARTTADDSLNGESGYTKESCARAESLQSKRGGPDSSTYLEAAAMCPKYAQKFLAHHSNLEKLFAQTGKVEAIVSQVASLKELAKDKRPQGDSTGVLSGAASLLWVVVAAIIAAATVFALVAGKSGLNQRDVTAALTQGFGMVNASLTQLHGALSVCAWPAGVEGNAQGDTDGRGTRRREHDVGFAQQSEALSAEVRQGFRNLQESLQPISNSLGTISFRLSERPDETACAITAETPAKTNADSSLEASPPADGAGSASSPLPGAMSVADYTGKFALQANVKPGFQTGYLQNDDDGQLIVLRDDQSGRHYLIPAQELLQTTSFFNQYYASYYDGTDLKTGRINIIRPALVRQIGAQWQLEARGALTTQRYNS